MIALSFAMAVVFAAAFALSFVAVLVYLPRAARTATGHTYRDQNLNPTLPLADCRGARGQLG